MERDAAVAVQVQDGLRGPAGGLPQQREAHEQAAGSVALPAGRLVLLQRIVEPVLEPLHRVGTVHRVSVWQTRRTQGLLLKCSKQGQFGGQSILRE